jgi:hypothetical protein
MSAATRQYLDARVATVRAVSHANGWNLHTVNREQLAASAVFFYVFDHQASRAWVCSIQKEDFHDVRERLSQMPMAEAVALTEHAMRACVGVAAPEPHAEEELAVALSAYISKTQVYAQTDNAELAPHFVVIHYAKSRTLRPFAMPGSDRFMLRTNTVLNAISSVISRDRQDHPQWLA